MNPQTLRACPMTCHLASKYELLTPAGPQALCFVWSSRTSRSPESKGVLHMAARESDPIPPLSDLSPCTQKRKLRPCWAIWRVPLENANTRCATPGCRFGLLVSCARVSRNVCDSVEGLAATSEPVRRQGHDPLGIKHTRSPRTWEPTSMAQVPHVGSNRIDFGSLHCAKVALFVVARSGDRSRTCRTRRVALPWDPSGYRFRLGHTGNSSHRHDVAQSPSASFRRGGGMVQTTLSIMSIVFQHIAVAALPWRCQKIL